MYHVEQTTNELILDLAFQAKSKEISTATNDCKTIELLTSSGYWEENIKIWLQIIRKNTTLDCPQIVRKSNFLSLGLELTDDLTIKNLNKIWRQKNTSTDVLSFPVIDKETIFPTQKQIELGDIVVSIPTAQRQAKEQKIHLTQELLWLVSHGLLHLLGWDHPDDKTLTEMLDLQEFLLGTNQKVQDNTD